MTFFRLFQRSKGNARGRPARRKGLYPIRWVRLFLEFLEDRVAPATVNWVNAAGGDWDTATNWSTGSIPGSGDLAVTNLAKPNVTVTHAGGADAIQILVSKDAVRLYGGQLT